MTAPSFKTLIFDTTPLLNGNVPFNSADEFFTVKEVLEEVKDKASRERLSTFYSLQVKEPTKEALTIVMDAARTTGDLPSLSRTDIVFLALCVTLDKELAPAKEYKILKPAQVTVEPKPTVESKEPVSKETVDTKEDTTKLSAEPSIKEEKEPEWITKDNFVETSEPKDNVQKISLGCVSGDNAVQNVLLALKIKAYDGNMKRVRQTKSFLMRCHACGWCCDASVINRFCQACGSPCLMKCSYSVSASTGQKTIWLKANFDYNLRGTVFSIGKPKGGRQNDLVLRGDQREYQRAITRQAQAKAKQLSEDDIDGRLAAVFGEACTMSNKAYSQQAGKAMIGHGRRNPNEVRRK